MRETSWKQGYRDFLQAHLFFSLALVYECTYKHPMPSALPACVCLSSGHCYACLAAGRRCALPGCRCTRADGRACSSRRYGAEHDGPGGVFASVATNARRAPAMPLPVLEGGGSDESIVPEPSVSTVRYCPDCGNCDCPNVSSDPYWRRCPATDRLAPPRVCTTSEGLIEALTASVAVTAPRASWSQRPAAVHAAARPLTTEDLDAHERRRLARIAPSLAKRVVTHSRARGVV